jgi:hypothetical protein
MAKLFKERLIAIAERLMSDEPLTQAEMDRLIDDFEASTYWHASDLIFDWRHKFKDAPEIVEYALGDTKLLKLTRDELVEVTRKLMTAEISDEFESNYLSRLFDANIEHPAKGDLIFYPEIEFKTPGELVDYALAYKPPKK